MIQLRRIFLIRHCELLVIISTKRNNYYEKLIALLGKGLDSIKLDY